MLKVSRTSLLLTACLGAIALRAIDHADETVRLGSDQRGVKRGKKPDIGAYERRAKKK